MKEELLEESGRKVQIEKDQKLNDKVNNERGTTGEERQDSQDWRGSERKATR